jgi:hypothetical protein
MLEELYVVLEINRDDTVRSLGHYNSANSKFFTVVVGEVGAKREADLAEAKWNSCRTFKAFPLNSAEAFQAIYGAPGITNRGEEPSGAQERRFRLAVEPLMRYLGHAHHPHVKVIVGSDCAELVEGICTHRTDKFILD